METFPEHPPQRPPFEAVVTQHGATVLRVCRALLGPHDAEDAWQECFISALRAYPSLPAGANVEAWLVTIAHRKAIDSLRASARRALPAGAGTEADELGRLRQASSGGAAGPGRPPAPDPEHAEAARELWRVVASLPERQRQAVAYRFLGGLGHAEVAAIVGVTPEAARRAASDGLRALRSRLGTEAAAVTVPPTARSAR